MLYVTKSVEFSAAHRLNNPNYSERRNEEVFDKCNNPHGHGHNYRLEVTIAGNPNPETGYVIDLKKLKKLLDEEIIEKVDHKHLNYDVEFLRGIIPTVENLAIVFWRILEERMPEGRLHSVKLFETENSWAEYFGEPVVVKNYTMDENW